MDSYEDESGRPLSVNSDERQALLGKSGEEGVKTEVEVKRTATWFSSWINLANTILGAGMLGLPYALSKNGTILGSLLIVLSGLASAFGLYLLVKCTDIVGGQTSYYVLARRALHENAAVLIDCIVFIKCFGVAISYLIVMGDLMPAVASFFLGKDVVDSVLLTREFWIGILAILVVPTAFLRQLNSLRFTSALALLAVAYLVLMVISMFFTVDFYEPEEPRFAFRMDTCFFAVMTIYVFGFTCHQNIFSIYNELTNPSPARINSVIFAAIGSAGVIYVIVGVLGYLQFGSSILGNIVENYPTVSAATVGRLFIVLLVAFSFALQTHPARICLDNIVKAFSQFVLKKELGPQTNMRYYIETIGIVAGTYTVAFLVSDLSVVLAFVGAIGSTTMCYILPGIFYLRLTGIKPLGPIKLASMFMILTGCFIMPTALIFIFMSNPECD